MTPYVLEKLKAERKSLIAEIELIKEDLLFTTRQLEEINESIDILEDHYAREQSKY